MAVKFSWSDLKHREIYDYNFYSPLERITDLSAQIKETLFSRDSITIFMWNTRFTLSLPIVGVCTIGKNIYRYILYCRFAREIRKFISDRRINKPPVALVCSALYYVPVQCGLYFRAYDLSFRVTYSFFFYKKDLPSKYFKFTKQQRER